MAATKVEIQAADGTCPAYVFKPAGTGPWPAVLVFMDGIGIREAMLGVGEQIARHGYYVLLPDLYYRSGPYAPMNAKTVFVDPDQRKRLQEEFMAKAPQPAVMRDTKFFLDWIATQPDVKPGPVATTGYCMGGGLSLSAAGTYPDRVAASASFHGGRLATDKPESPHLLAPKMKAKVYVAGAVEDSTFPDDMKQRLEEALAGAGVDHEVVTYPAKHGFVIPDHGAYDPAAAERHWKTLIPFFDEALKS